VQRGIATLATLGGIALAAGCSDAQAPSAASPAGVAPSSSSSNERTLTHAQSVHLVQWATTWKRCMSDHGWALGQLTKAPTRLSMAVPEDAELMAVMHDSVACGDAQGGPPSKSSLQFRARTILLYLPKQCLLDPKVVSS
jgi:hypothetical protein